MPFENFYSHSLRSKSVFIMHWIIALIAFGLVLPIHTKGNCKYNQDCDKSNETCVQDVEGYCLCRMPVGNYRLCASQLEESKTTNHTDEPHVRIKEESARDEGSMNQVFHDTNEEGTTMMGWSLATFVIVTLVIIVACLLCCVGLGVLIYFIVKMITDSNRRDR